MSHPALYTTTAHLRSEYHQRCVRAWDPTAARRRFSEYDQFRATWCSELFAWLQGDNPRAVHSLTQFAWKVQHDCFSNGGYNIVCLEFNERSQRIYLGDGLLIYLGILKDMIEGTYQSSPATEPQPYGEAGDLESGLNQALSGHPSTKEMLALLA